MSDDAYLTAKEQRAIYELTVQREMKVTAAQRRYERSIQAIDRQFRQSVERAGLTKFLQMMDEVKP